MKNIYILIVCSLFSLCISSVNEINIGTVKIEITPSSINISNGEAFSESFSYHTERGGHIDFIKSSASVYFYHLNDWRDSIQCYDYEPSTNPDAIKMMGTIEAGSYEWPNSNITFKNLQKEDFVKFSFFNKEETSIGFIFGSVGASAGSGKLMIFNTENNEYLVTEFGLYCDFFIDTGLYPPSIQSKKFIFLGTKWKSLGRGSRIWEIQSFKNGVFTRDEFMENKIFLSNYNQSKLSDKDFLILEKYNLSDALALDSSSKEGLVYHKLTDFLYYSKKLGKTDEMLEIINKVHPDVKEKILDSWWW